MKLIDTLSRVTFLIAVVLCSCEAAHAQSSKEAEPTAMAKDASPDWEVLSVRPSDPNASGATFDVRGRHIIIGNRTVETMLRLAYGLQKNQIVGAPDWVRTEHFDADGIPSVEGQPSLEQFRSLLSKLLTERFGLVTHKESRELLVYAITIAKGGPKMAASTADPNALQSDSNDQSDGQRTIQMSNATMAGFALELMYNTDRPVVDRTGLSGRYDFTLKWAPADSKAPEDGSAAPSLFTAIQEQMATKVGGGKGNNRCDAGRYGESTWRKLSNIRVCTVEGTSRTPFFDERRCSPLLGSYSATSARMPCRKQSSLLVSA